MLRRSIFCWWDGINLTAFFSKQMASAFVHTFECCCSAVKWAGKSFQNSKVSIFDLIVLAVVWVFFKDRCDIVKHSLSCPHWLFSFTFKRRTCLLKKAVNWCQIMNWYPSFIYPESKLYPWLLQSELRWFIETGDGYHYLIRINCINQNYLVTFQHKFFHMDKDSCVRFLVITRCQFWR